MGFLPVPGEIYLNDFPDKNRFSIYRAGSLVTEADGLTNSDEDGRHIAFLYGTDVSAGDSIRTRAGKEYQVKLTDTDTYNGTPSIVKAYY